MTEPDGKVIFYITEEELQRGALERIGRKLTWQEVHSAVTGLEYGLHPVLFTVIPATIDLAVEMNKK